MMEKQLPFAIGGVLFYCALLMAGCASTELVDIWSDPSFHASSLKKILVIAVSKDGVHRRMWEDAFSLELGQHDVVAMPSYRLFPDAVPDTNQVVGVVRSNGFDGILITRWLPPETQTQYMQGYVTKEQDLRYDLRRERFVTYYTEVEHAGYLDSQKVSIRDIDVWTTSKDGQMIWSATSKTPEPVSGQSARPEIVSLVMADLTRQLIIASAP